MTDVERKVLRHMNTRDSLGSKYKVASMIGICTGLDRATAEAVLNSLRAQGYVERCQTAIGITWVISDTGEDEVNE